MDLKAPIDLTLSHPISFFFFAFGKSWKIMLSLLSEICYNLERYYLQYSYDYNNDKYHDLYLANIGCMLI